MWVCFDDCNRAMLAFRAEVTTNITVLLQQGKDYSGEIPVVAMA
jgi:hypothetical protein